MEGVPGPKVQFEIIATEQRTAEALTLLTLLNCPLQGDRGQRGPTGQQGPVGKPVTCIRFFLCALN